MPCDAAVTLMDRMILKGCLADKRGECNPEWLKSAGVFHASIALCLLMLVSACATRPPESADLRMIDPKIQGDIKAVIKTVLKGMGGDIAWPALMRKLDRMDPSYKT